MQNMKLEEQAEILPMNQDLMNVFAVEWSMM